MGVTIIENVKNAACGTGSPIDASGLLSKMPQSESRLRSTIIDMIGPEPSARPTLANASRSLHDAPSQLVAAVRSVEETNPQPKCDEPSQTASGSKFLRCCMRCLPK